MATDASKRLFVDVSTPDEALAAVYIRSSDTGNGFADYRVRTIEWREAGVEDRTFHIPGHLEGQSIFVLLEKIARAAQGKPY
jgi:hypothetical protein